MKKIRTYLRRPFAQLMILIILISAWSPAMDRLHEFYRGGAHWSPWAVWTHVVVLAVGGLFLRQFDRIEACMKAGAA